MTLKEIVHFYFSMVCVFLCVCVSVSVSVCVCHCVGSARFYPVFVTQQPKWFPGETALVHALEQ